MAVAGNRWRRILRVLPAPRPALVGRDLVGTRHLGHGWASADFASALAWKLPCEPASSQGHGLPSMLSIAPSRPGPVKAGSSVSSKILGLNRIIGGWCRYYQTT